MVGSTAGATSPPRMQHYNTGMPKISIMAPAAWQWPV